MAQAPRDGDPADDPTAELVPPFPTYEELAGDLLESLEAAGLSIDDVRHELEPGIGERRFEVTVRQGPDPMSRYHAHLSFTWDALLTYVSANGGASECDLYHDDDDEVECPHQRLRPQPFVEIEVEIVLGDGGYELHDVDEVSSWVDTVQSLLGKTFPEDDRPSIHVGLAALGSVVLVEKLTAEHSWLVDFDGVPDYAAIGKQVAAALKVVPQLADRLPI